MDVFALFARVTRRARKVLSHSSSLLAVAVYRSNTPSTTMFSSQLGRAARVGSQSASISTSTCAVANRVSSATCPTLLSRQRRLSSSKASCPPNGDSNRSRQPAAATKPDLPSSRPAKSRSSTANKNNSASRNVKAAKDETFANLPSVPSTEHLLPQGVYQTRHREPDQVINTLSQTSPSHLSSVFTVLSAWAPPSHLLPTSPPSTTSSSPSLSNKRQTRTSSSPFPTPSTALRANKEIRT
jgi:hypothetical protein